MAPPPPSHASAPAPTATPPRGPPREEAAPSTPTDAGDTAAQGGTERLNTEEEGAPRCKHRRGQAAEDTADAYGATQDTRRALQLRQQQQAAAAAGGFGTEAAVQMAAQLHAQHVAQIVNAAMAQGVQPLTPMGEELIMLGPQELAAWADENLKQW